MTCCLPGYIWDMIEWKRVPWSLWVYFGVVLLGTVRLEVEAHGPVGVKGLFLLVMIVWLYLLFKGIWWVWGITLVIYVLGFVSFLSSGSLSVIVGTSSVAGLVLLLLPVTRRYFVGDVPATGAK